MNLCISQIMYRRIITGGDLPTARPLWASGRDHERLINQLLVCFLVIYLSTFHFPTTSSTNNAYDSGSLPAKSMQRWSAPTRSYSPTMSVNCDGVPTSAIQGSTPLGNNLSIFACNSACVGAQMTRS